MPGNANAYDFDHFAPKKAEPIEMPAKGARKAAEKKKKPANVVQLSEKQLRRSHRHNANAARTLLGLICVLGVVLTVGAVVFGQVQLTELTDQIHAAEQALSEEKSLSVQLDMQAGSNMNTDQIAEYARDKLGMQKLTENQTTYISLSQGDNGTVVQEDAGGGFFTRIWKAILSVFS